MSLLLPVASDIIFSTDPTDTAFLATIQLLAIATHPTAFYILYALYGLGATANSNSYTGYQLQAWDASTGAHLLKYNQTLTDTLNCTMGC